MSTTVNPLPLILIIVTRQLNIYLIALFAFSCFPVPRRFKQEFNCYTGQYTGLDTLINIHGFYNKMTIHDHTGSSGMKDGKYQKLGIDTSSYSVVFFNDGFFVGEGGQLAGTYVVRHDTIKVKYICTNCSANNAWYGSETWYKIIDKNTIVDFYRRPLGLLPSDRKKQAYQPKMYSNANPSKFVHVLNMPKFYISLT